MRALLLFRNFVFSNKLFIFFFGLLGLLSISIAISSLFWTIDGDNIGLLYAAFLTDKFHLIPYRDFFYFQLPFVHFFYLLLLKIFGYSILGFRIANLIFLLVFSVVSYLLFKKISIKTAVCGIITFSLIYFIGRTYLSLQRDYVLILPVIAAILYSYSYPNKKINSKSFFLGFCCALSSSIKPHAIIIFPVLFIFNILSNTDNGLKNHASKIIIKQLLFSVMGFSLPLLFTVLYLWFTGSFNPFWDIQTNFTVLYRDSKMFLEINPSETNIFTRILKFHTYRPFLLPAACGFYISIFRSNLNRQQKLLIYELAALIVFFLLYVIIAAKFFWYHWLPFAYFTIFLSSACFVEQKKSANKFASLSEFIPPLIIFLIIGIQIGREQNRDIFIEELSGKSREYSAPHPFYDDIITSAEFLKINLKPGDKVLPLDNTSTAIYSMYLARAEMASYYSLVTVFYLGEKEFPNSEYFHRTHKDYMDKFRAANPRFVLNFAGSNIFIDLKQILETEYNAISLKYGTLYQRKNE
ncbi:MAG: hypothetical protein EHM58_08855 [Ignavibacteriae bacterium]|nr:MAG: hypothetical protein EHM58_08855 [Ignavibacteriota bacterium]